MRYFVVAELALLGIEYEKVAQGQAHPNNGGSVSGGLDAIKGVFKEFHFFREDTLWLTHIRRD